MSGRNQLLIIAFAIFIAYGPNALGQTFISGQLGYAENEVQKSLSTGQTAEQLGPKSSSTQMPAISTEAPSEQLSIGGPNDFLNITGDILNGGNADVFWWGDTPAQWAMAGTGVFALFVSIWAVFLIYKTLKVTRETLREAEDATKAAEVAAGESKRQADIAESSVHRLERPYLFLKLVQIQYLANPRNNQPFLTFKFVNHGRMPAILQRISVNLAPSQVMPAQLPENWGYDVYEVLEPRGESEAHRAFVQGAQPGEKWQSDDAAQLVLHGSIRYHDATGSTLYTDGFCFRLKENAQGLTIFGGEEYNFKNAVGQAMFIERA